MWQREAVGLECKISTENHDAFVRNAVVRAGSTAGIDKEATKYEEETNTNEWDTPKLEEEWRICVDYGKLPKGGEATPENTERNEI